MVDESIDPHHGKLKKLSQLFPKKRKQSPASCEKSEHLGQNFVHIYQAQAISLKFAAKFRVFV